MDPSTRVNSLRSMPSTCSASSSASFTSRHALERLSCVSSLVCMICSMMGAATSARNGSYSTSLSGRVGARRMMEAIWNLDRPRSASRIPWERAAGRSSPVPARSKFWHDSMRNATSSVPDRRASSTSRLMSWIMSVWNSGTNSSSDTLPSWLASTSIMAMLISRRVRFSGRLWRYCENSSMSSSPLPSVSASAKASRREASISSLLIPL
mmetsp:Transcript_11811/g.25354  ORF Transcript_11811/g.25354 Transcript_11811/m.25354 type:complete len:210 (+) Transcript_11811:259-888(+)